MHKLRYPNSAPLLGLASMALLCTAAWAQPAEQGLPAAPPDQAQTIPSAGAATSRSGQSTDGIALQLMGTLIEVRPSVKAEIRQNDNIYSTPNAVASDRILVLTPALELAAKQGANNYILRMTSVIGRYQKYKTEDYANNTVNALADLDLGTRVRTRLEAEYVDGVDPRGSSNNALSLTPDHYRQTRGRGIFSLGAPGAQGRLDLELGRWQREYLNNLDTTAASDRVVDDLGATFHWHLGPRTSLLFQGKHSTVDYDDPASTLDSTESALLVGGTWDASAKTSGTFRVGPVNKTFDDSSRKSYTSVGWLGAVRWSPRTYSHVDLSLSRAPTETSGGVGDYIEKTSTDVRWTHAWSTTLTTEALASYVNDDYQGAARADNTQDYGLRATYRMRRWLSFGAGYAYTNRDSTDNNYNYRRNVLMFFAEATL